VTTTTKTKEKVREVTDKETGEVDYISNLLFFLFISFQFMNILSV